MVKVTARECGNPAKWTQPPPCGLMTSQEPSPAFCESETEGVAIITVKGVGKDELTLFTEVGRKSCV